MSEVREWTAVDAAAWVTAPHDEDDKYSRGVVGFATGSERYPGAAVIGVDAALHTGVGMVRYSGPAAVGRLVLGRRPEAVLEAGRAEAWVIGSGTAGDSDDDALPADVAGRAGTAALILDAGAIGAARSNPGPTIVTPHAGELARVLGSTRADVLADPVAAAQQAAHELGAVVLLKGATTYLVHAERVVAVRQATPWLATAGAGDSLAGVLGALVATRAARGPIAHDDLVGLGATAAFVHGRAARLASRLGRDGPRGGPFTVLDLNARLPDVVRQLLA